MWLKDFVRPRKALSICWDDRPSIRRRRGPAALLLFHERHPLRLNLARGPQRETRLHPPAGERRVKQRLVEVPIKASETRTASPFATWLKAC